MKYSEFAEMQWDQGFDVIEPFKIDVAMKWQMLK